MSAGVARIRELEGKYKGKVYGQLIDLFECNEAAMTAVEVAAGGRFVLSRLIGYLSCLV